ncbi:hypothetical protein [Chromatium okenii]|uniref:Uncharacterized protein n=1 Tax=Chromatium okenii TaxID=61644 RepID=A0A2S7XSV9_9GAMM|nr:hypothetical protein [Chromatium okenii]PQJ96827.1 hypothetical protein CXB77_05640 [Chromatium okenii]
MTQSYSNAATNSNQKAVSNQKDTAQTSTCYLTVCTRIDGKPAGKTYTLANGEVTKEVAGHSGRYTALRHRVASLSELSTLLASLTPAQTLIYGHCVECGDLPYQILPDKTCGSG